jgi:plasmid stability protein
MDRESLDQRAQFVELFADAWRIGATQPERFFEHFDGRLTSDAVMIQPLLGRSRGPRSLQRLFEPLFAVMPGLRGEVLRWGATRDGVVIELALRGAVHGRSVEWTAVDRIVLRDGLIAERRSYFDPLPLVMALLSRPGASLKLLAMLLGQKEVR